ncbi:MAG TPA: YeeE/YedE thiosulfate transporter family protein [Kofleriaceae bacterium]|nr:YeeE/YedE thiosulfate transporter family protein [Kofleriaceae bacterium]
MNPIVSALALGFLFGWFLHKAGLTRYGTIVNVYRLRDLTVIRFMLVALVVGGVGSQLLVELGLAHGLPVPPFRPAANLVGGVVFGVGMATAGYCPGTVVAQAGEGHLDAWIAGLGGLVTGAILFAMLQPHVVPPLAAMSSFGRVTIPNLLGASPWLVLVVFAQLTVLLLLALRHRH